jgi:predicted amidohydrolase YtcJ
MRSMLRHGLGLIGLALASGAASTAPPPPDLIIVNARIYTADATHSVVSALAVRGGRIVFAGAEDAARRLAGPQTQLRDLGGKLVLPGLIDSHIHPERVIEYPACDLQARPLSLAQISREVKDCIARRGLAPGEWVLVDLWNFSEGMQTDPAHPTIRAALDAASTEHPIKLFGLDGHHFGFNSMALAMAAPRGKPAVGLNAATIKSHFARYAPYIGVDQAGEPDGYITESAAKLFPAAGSIGPDAKNLGDAPEKIGQMLSSRGIVALLDAGGGPTNYRIFDSLQTGGTLNLHVRFAQDFDFDEFTSDAGTVDFGGMILRAMAVRNRYAANPLIRADMVKLYADGVLEGNPRSTPPTLPNSPMLKPFLQPIFGKDAAGRMTVKGYVETSSALCRDTRAHLGERTAKAAEFIAAHGFHPAQCKISWGTFEHPAGQLMEFSRRFHQAGFTLHIHAIGDKAVRVSIDAIEAARKSDGIASQPDAIAHLQVIAPRDVLRIGRGRIYTAFTFAWANAVKDYDMTVMPFIDRVHGNSDAALYNLKNYTYRQSYPAHSVLRAGGQVVGGSDAPVESRDPRPFYNIQYAVTRQHPGMPRFNPAEALTIWQALDAYTITGARGLGLGDVIGSLEVGKEADFIVLDRDVLALAQSPAGSQTIRDTRVLETWFQGRLVYTAN